jgi:hypothetical protein
MIRLHIQITEQQRLLLQKFNKDGRSVSAFVRDILDEHFKELKKAKQMR